jgi:hypothetical protein
MASLISATPSTTRSRQAQDTACLKLLLNYGAQPRGSNALAQRLIERGADPVSRSGAKCATPVAWAALGSQYPALPGCDYVVVVETLILPVPNWRSASPKSLRGRRPTGLTGKLLQARTAQYALTQLESLS